MKEASPEKVGGEMEIDVVTGNSKIERKSLTPPVSPDIIEKSPPVIVEETRTPASKRQRLNPEEKRKEKEIVEKKDDGRISKRTREDNRKEVTWSPQRDGSEDEVAPESTDNVSDVEDGSEMGILPPGSEEEQSSPESLRANTGDEPTVPSREGPVEGFTKEDLPPPNKPNEIEFILNGGAAYAVGQNIRSELSQPHKEMPFRFRLFIFPRGTTYCQGEAISAFLEVDPATEGEGSLEHHDVHRWVFQSVSYCITVINWHDYRKSITKENTWTFTSEHRDRGWHEFVPAANLFNPAKGWMGPNGEVAIRATALCSRAECIDTTHSYQSKKETGYIGLKNHGATCYMNSLLQSLFLLGKFRELVYSLDFDDALGRDSEDEENVSVAQALQEVFYKMQTSDVPQTTKRLMKSFGWDSLEAFTQHDAQELNRLLCDRLEMHIQNSKDVKTRNQKGIIKDMFEGQMTNYIECLEIDYKSERTEPFWDIQLNIKGQKGQILKNVDEAFEDFVSEEILQGENAYDAGQLGKQRARKGIRFSKFPPILNLQLKRFQFDMEKFEMVKLNNKFEFSEKLDVSKYVPNEGNVKHIYDLHSVVVHRGDVHAGHYYVHIRPHVTGRWLKFDDDVVTHCSQFAAIGDNFGGEDPIIENYFQNSPGKVNSSQSRSRIHSSYMLVYLRSDLCEEWLRPPDPIIINPKMVERCQKRAQELEEKRRKKIERQHKITVQVVFDHDLQKIIGFWDFTKIQNPYEEIEGKNNGPLLVFKFCDRDKTIRELLNEISQHSKSGNIPVSHMTIFYLEYRSTPPDVPRLVRFAHANPNSSIRSLVPSFALPHFDPLEPVFTCYCAVSPKYAPPGPGIQVNPVDTTNILKNWQGEQHMMLIVKYFCRKEQKIISLGAWFDVQNKLLKDSLIPWAISKLDAATFGIEPMEWNASRIQWSAWEEFSYQNLQERKLTHTPKQEGLWIGDVIILQAMDPSASIPKDDQPRLTKFPTKPVITVQEYSENLSNETEVSVTVHDPSERWTDDTDDEAIKDRRKIIVTLDKRWTISYSSAVIAKHIDDAIEIRLENPPLYWLFFLPPTKMSTEPINDPTRMMAPSDLSDDDSQPANNIGDFLHTHYKHHGEEPTTGPIQKFRPIFHVVKNPFRKINGTIDNLKEDRRPFCIRCFNDRVQEKKCIIVYCETHDADVILAEKIIEQVKKEDATQVPEKWRLLRIEEGDGKILKIFRPGDPVPTSLTGEYMNIFCDYLRLEADDTPIDLIDVPPNINRGIQEIEFYHADQPRLSLNVESHRLYGQPFLMTVAHDDLFLEIKRRIGKKLQISEAELRRWRFLYAVNSVQIKDEESIEPQTNQIFMVHERNKKDCRSNRALTMKRG